ncbi:MAG: hypothetical protein IIC13_12595 [SAR324 cluster bacterium]|nr:hypothetical protein [SAR324 cluster bacterium]
MGEDEPAVADSRLNVRGLRGPRVVDASIMPNITLGNTAAPLLISPLTNNPRVSSSPRLKGSMRGAA